jgi:hypothetical protein
MSLCESEYIADVLGLRPGFSYRIWHSNNGIAYVFKKLLGVGEAVVVGERVALSILLSFLCNISFRLSCTAQTLVLSYHHLLTIVLARVVVAG